MVRIFIRRICLVIAAGFIAFAPPRTAPAQTAPSKAEIAAYTGLHKAAHENNIKTIKRLGRNKAALEARDGAGRTPAHVAAFASHEAALEALARAGANLNALEGRKYDIVTIASVANDLPFLKAALKLGASAKNITSPYDGTALIAAAHLGHAEVVKTLIAAGAPLDHVNNLNWTAVIEAIVLGDGGKNHIACLRALVDAGADIAIPDGQARTPLELAKAHGFQAMVKILSGKK